MDMFSQGGEVARGWCRKAALIAPPQGESGPEYADRKSIVIAMTPRSGSSYLTGLMRLNGLGAGQEHFRVSGGSMEKFVAEKKVTSYDQYVRSMIEARTLDGVFTAKADWLQFLPIYYLGAYDAYFRNAAYVYLTRGDLLMQAISRFLGTETGYFHSINTDKAHTRDQHVPMDFDKITGHLNHLIAMQSAWESFFSAEGISPMRVLYEELEVDPAKVIRDMCALIGREPPATVTLETEYEKVRNSRNEQIRSEYMDEARRRRHAGFAEYQNIRPTDRRAG